MNESTNEADSDSLWPQVRGTLISWGIPAVISSFPLISWFDGVVDFFRGIGWRFVVVSFSITLFLAIFFCVAWIKSLCREKAMSKKLNEDFRQYLQPVQDLGYKVDTRNNQPVCPKCEKDGHLSYMAKEVSSDNSEKTVSLKCHACDKIIRPDGSHHNKRSRF